MATIVGRMILPTLLWILPKPFNLSVELSELTTRKDAHKESVKSVNKLLIKYSKQHQWSLVRHSNITEKVLNRGGLHLTKQGNELLYKNFASCLAAKEANHH